MTSQKGFLEHLVMMLDAAGIAYMLSGSLGSSFHGQPRATNDADIVIDPTKEQLLFFIASLEPDYYLSREAAMQAIENRSMFNIIDIQAGWKADLIIRKNRAYSRQEFARRKKAAVMGMTLCIVSPEDSILSKLEWSKGRQSGTQFNDVLGILVVQWKLLDFEYLKKWAIELGVEEMLEQLINEVNKRGYRS